MCSSLIFLLRSPCVRPNFFARFFAASASTTVTGQHWIWSISHTSKHGLEMIRLMPACLQIRLASKKLAGRYKSTSVTMKTFLKGSDLPSGAEHSRLSLLFKSFAICARVLGSFFKARIDTEYLLLRLFRYSKYCFSVTSPLHTTKYRQARLRRARGLPCGIFLFREPNASPYPHEWIVRIARTNVS